MISRIPGAVRINVESVAMPVHIRKIPESIVMNTPGYPTENMYRDLNARFVT